MVSYPDLPPAIIYPPKAIGVIKDLWVVDNPLVTSSGGHWIVMSIISKGMSRDGREYGIWLQLLRRGKGSHSD